MLKYRKPNLNDLSIYYNWANDRDVREQSYNSQLIDFAEHVRWFQNSISNVNFFMLIFENNLGEDVGQVRIQKQGDLEAIISISIDAYHRGKGYAKEMLIISSNLFLKENENFVINAYIKNGNLASKYSFEEAKFIFREMLEYKNVYSFHYIKTNYENR
jgi:spore coat polysaccharide biosynthesis protein SpsF